MKKIIYDFGANDGADIPYYLKKADFVVAVEADPNLCEIIEQRFRLEILAGRLVVENCVIAVGDAKKVAFYRHRKHPDLNQFPRPEDSHLENFEEIFLRAKSPARIVQENGDPFYIKIDIEHYDAIVLEDLFANGIRPPFISAESHSIEVFCALVLSGGYKSFNIVDGKTVNKEYGNCLIKTKDVKLETYSFPLFSAGPFGDDIKSDWVNAENCMKLLTFHGLGWKDLHATKMIEPSTQKRMKFRHLAIRSIRKRIQNKLIRLGRK